MTRRRGSRTTVEARGSVRRTRWWACGALATIAALGLIVFAISENRQSSVVPPAATVEIPEDTGSPAHVAAGDSIALHAPLAGTVDTTMAQVAREAKGGRVTPPASKLDPFYEALFKLRSAGTSEPVTILHLGDSHIAADRITGEVRALLQARFGDAGRGLMMPGFPFPYYKVRGVDFEKAGKWTAANSLNEDGVYGITGVSLTGSDADAVLKLTSTSGPFISPQVWLLAGPGGGHAVVRAAGKSEEVATAADARAVLRVSLPVKATSLSVEVKGDGPVTVLGLSVDSGRPGVRYVNLGIPSASALTTRRFDRALAASDIATLAPKLVVLSYGTNEGFIDTLDLAAYEKEYVRLVELVKAAAPDAALLILGPLDGTRLPRFVTGDARVTAPCRPLSVDEQADYGELLERQDKSLARWHEPPKLEAVRSLFGRIAERYHATYWDLSAFMGGSCSIDRWAKAEPPLAFPDHVHLSDEGSKRVGQAIYENLIKGYERFRQQASAGGSLAASDADDGARERVRGP
jgi:lysophospholipase L1-like esterase